MKFFPAGSMEARVNRVHAFNEATGDTKGCVADYVNTRVVLYLLHAQLKVSFSYGHAPGSKNKCLMV